MTKVVIPQFLADYIERSKEFGFDIGEALDSDKSCDDVTEFLYGHTKKANEKNYLIAVRAWVEGYEIEQPKKYYWRKEEEYSVWFETVIDTYLAQCEEDGELTLGLLEGAGWKCKFTETEARDLLKDDFDKFEKVECK